MLNKIKINKQNSKLRTKVGIVTTVADAAEHIEFFIQYHLSIGIEHIFIFIDDQCEETYRTAGRYSQATPLYVDETLKEYWKNLPCYRSTEKRELRDTEVMVRQEYNAHLGFSLAKDFDLDWLLHIDVDELFFPNGNSLDDHYREMQIKGVGGCVYCNYEAIPTKQQSECIYTATPFFKRNFFKRGHWFFREDQRDFISATPWLSDFYFNYYQNGKSAANAHHELVVGDVHAMWGNGTQLKLLGQTDPIILHFPSITLKEFHKKYQRLGQFDDEWKGFPRAGKFIDTFHLEARDALRSGGIESLTGLFESRMMLSKDKIDRLIEHDLAVEINEVVDFANQSTPKIEGSPSSLKIGYNITQSVGPSNSEKVRTLDINSVATETLSAPLIAFQDIASARLWLRRHPALPNGGLCPVKHDQEYNITYRRKQLCDFGNLNLEALAEAISKEVGSDEYGIIPICSPIYCSSYEGKTDFDIAVQRVRSIKELITAKDFLVRDKIFVEVGDDKEYLFFNMGGCRLVDAEFKHAINESVKANSLSPLALYIASRYPRHPGFDWAIDLGTVRFRNGAQKDAILAVACALGGTLITYGEHTNAASEQFRSVRSRYPMIATNYAHSHKSDHQELIFLAKEDQHLKFLAIINTTPFPTSIDAPTLNDLKLDETWYDLLSDQQLPLRDNCLRVAGNGYLWLASKKNTADYG
jgi:hypothetical protein